jgi:hypothetical protein
MTVDRAILVIDEFLSSTHVEARCKTNYYGGAWVIFAVCGDFERPLTQTLDPGIAARWINEFDRKKAETLGMG